MPVDSQQPTDLFKRLKQCTAEIHERVEQRLQIFSPEFDLPAYINLLARFCGFWSPLEKELKTVPELKDPSLALDTRLKAHLLEADLRSFGIDPASVLICSPLPDVRTFHRALGCLYVLEGSTLGAQFIAGHISGRFAIGEDSGGSFFNAYGSAVPQRWSDFRAFVRSRVESEQVDELHSGAKETFEALDAWLSSAH
jgi:heme oxygenase (biliverdin-IX-beta and delta-forming)